MNHPEHLPKRVSETHEGRRAVRNKGTVEISYPSNHVRADGFLGHGGQRQSGKRPKDALTACLLRWRCILGKIKSTVLGSSSTKTGEVLQYLVDHVRAKLEGWIFDYPVAVTRSLYAETGLGAVDHACVLKM
jgi:hypothetical protein